MGLESFFEHLLLLQNDQLIAAILQDQPQSLQINQICRTKRKMIHGSVYGNALTGY